MHTVHVINMTGGGKEGGREKGKIWECERKKMAYRVVNKSCSSACMAETCLGSHP